MDRPLSPPNAVGLPIEHLFKDIYRLLESLQDPKEKLGSVATHLARCQHELSSLERIHTNRWRFHPNRDSSDDPFQLRETLNQFAVSCNALKYVNSPLAEFGDDVQDGCLSRVNLRRSWKKKHLKTLESEYFGHERALSLALTNAVYTTVLQMQRSTTTYEISLAQILRRAERRHHIFQCLEGPIRSTDRTKLESFRMEEMDWELCLRRYMDHVEAWGSGSEETGQTISRSSSVSQGSGRQVQRQSSNSSMRSSYGEFRITGELDTSVYYRPARRNSLHGQSQGDTSRTNSLTSVHSESSTALVLYSQPVQSSSTAMARMLPSSQSSSMALTRTPPLPQPNSAALARPVRRASISRDFHWEYVGRSSTFAMLAPLAKQYPELRDAQADIFTQTQGMTSAEARAYAQGRLASLPPEVTDEVKNILSLQTQKDEKRNSKLPGRETTLELMQKDQKLSNLDPSPRPMVKEIRHITSALEIKQKEPKSSTLDPKPSPTSKEIRHSMNTLEEMRRQAKSKPHRKDVKPGPKNFKSKVRDLRPLTAISEKSTFSRSRASSVDQPANTRSLMQVLAARKSSLSINATPVPEIPNATESSLPEISPVLEEDQRTETPDSKPGPEQEKLRLRSLDSKSTRSTKSTPSLKSINKPLPPNPKFSKSALLAIFKPKQNKDLLAPPLPTSIGNLQSRAHSNHSKESVRRVSMDLLKRKDSKMTLFSVAEGLEVPFEMWLRALPYIEGRASSPRPPPMTENSI